MGHYVLGLLKRNEGVELQEDENVHPPHGELRSIFTETIRFTLNSCKSILILFY